VFGQALSILGTDWLLFDSESLFFPRGWVADVYEKQSAALDDIGATVEAREKIFGGNFDRISSIMPAEPETPLL
jgi:hypothetical protein